MALHPACPSPRAMRVLDRGTAQAPSRTESTTEPGVVARPMLAPWDGAFMEPRGCNWWQSTANRTGAEAPKTSQNRCRPLRPVAAMVRRGSTVRVRQRASGFFLLRCWFRFRGRRRIPDSTSTQRPPTSTACSWDLRTVSGSGPGLPGRTRQRDARLSPTDKLALHVGLWYLRARVKLIRTTSPVKRVG